MKVREMLHIAIGLGVFTWMAIFLYRRFSIRRTLRIVGMLIAIILVSALVAVLSKTIGLQQNATELVFIGSFATISLFLLFRRRGELTDTSERLSIENFRISSMASLIGILIIGLGGFLYIGNQTGAFRTFPYAGTLLVVLGAYIYAISEK